MTRYFVFFLMLFFLSFANAQHLQPGFDIAEYQEMLRINAGIYKTVDSTSGAVSKPMHATFQYRSPEMGLNNLYEL